LQAWFLYPFSLPQNFLALGLDFCLQDSFCDTCILSKFRRCGYQLLRNYRLLSRFTAPGGGETAVDLTKSGRFFQSGLLLPEILVYYIGTALPSEISKESLLSV